MLDHQGTVTSFAEALNIFEAAWRDPGCTTVELPALPVNEVLGERYLLTPSRRITRSDLWDMEEKKAYDPATYIPYVVSEGRSWSRTSLPDGAERHLRSSVQKAWLTGKNGVVLEEVVSQPAEQRIIFLGRQQLPGPSGEQLAADTFQPLFHVEHGVGGTEKEPTNLWRVVLLADEPRFAEPFDSMVRAGWLPGFLEIYLQRDLGILVQRAEEPGG